MDSEPSVRWRRAVGATTLAVALAGAVGYYPTVRLAGADASLSLLAGCLIGLTANLFGLVVLRLIGLRKGPQRMTATLSAMGVRFTVVLGLGVAAAVTGWFQPAPLLIWVATSHVLALLVETVWFVQALQPEGET